jgi:hypothetical protein
MGVRPKSTLVGKGLGRALNTVPAYRRITGKLDIAGNHKPASLSSKFLFRDHAGTSRNTIEAVHVLGGPGFDLDVVGMR